MYLRVQLKGSSVKRLCVLLVGMLTIAAIIPTLAPSMAQSAPAYVLYPKTTGSIGSYSVANPGAKCLSENTATAQIKLTAIGPVAKLVSGVTSGRVDWTPAVYQNLLDTRGYQVIRQGATQSLTISTNNTRSFQNTVFEHLPGGGFYSAGGTLTWYNSNSTVRGTATFVFAKYENGSNASPSTGYCNRVASPTLSVSTTRTTVDTVITLQGSNFPASQPVTILWKGTAVGTVTSDTSGNVRGTYKVAATPMGEYQLGFDGGLKWKLTTAVTIVPRVKVLPSNAGRGETVKISLRGFAKGETVRVRWIKGGSWVELGRVTMSSTGSGELWIPVPNWVPDGPSSVRGDGTSGRAQTNAVVIAGGASFTTASEQTPTPSPTPTATTTVTATATVTVPASPAISPTLSPTSTEVTATATPSPSETATETATATVTATETMVPTQTETDSVLPTSTVLATETSTAVPIP